MNKPVEITKFASLLEALKSCRKAVLRCDLDMLEKLKTHPRGETVLEVLATTVASPDIYFVTLRPDTVRVVRKYSPLLTLEDSFLVQACSINSRWIIPHDIMLRKNNFTKQRKLSDVADASYVAFYSSE